MMRSDRSLYPRPAARSRRSRQPAAARPDRQWHGTIAGRPAGERHPRRPQHGAGRPARIRPHALRGIVLEEGARDRACRHRRPLARPGGGRAGREHRLDVRDRRRHHRRWPGRHGASAADRPTSRQAYVDKVRLTAKRRAHYRGAEGHADRSPATACEITLLHNSGLVADLPMLDDTGAAGVGLFRTELQFMIASQAAAAAANRSTLYSEAIRHRRGQADRLPPARYRRRQGHPLSALGARGEPGHGLALAAAGARPAGPAAHPGPRPAAGRQWRAAQDPRADGHRGLGVPPDQAGDPARKLERLRACRRHGARASSSSAR